VHLTIYVYYWDPFEGWKCMDTRTWYLNSWDHGGELWEWIKAITPWYNLGYTEYSMATRVKVRATSTTTGECAWADFRSGGYYIWTVDMCIQALRWKP